MFYRCLMFIYIYWELELRMFYILPCFWYRSLVGVPFMFYICLMFFRYLYRLIFYKIKLKVIISFWAYFVCNNYIVFGLVSIKNKVWTIWKWTWMRSHYMLFSCRLSIFDLCHQVYVTSVIIVAQSRWIVRKTAMILCYYIRWTRLFKESLKVNNIRLRA